MDIMGLRSDESSNKSDAVKLASSSSASHSAPTPNGCGNDDSSVATTDSAVNLKEPMHSILKSHPLHHDKCITVPNPHEGSAPMDVPRSADRLMSCSESSPNVATLGNSPGTGSVQDLWWLWADGPEDTKNDEFHMIVPPTRRSASLKASKTPPGTPSPKKLVRFADTMGLDLEKVRHFFQDQIPNTGTPDDSPLRGVRNELARPILVSKYMSSMFPQPCLASNFLERIRGQKVCLDSVQTTDFAINGQVRVLNISFQKDVVVRYTFDNWKTSLDCVALYVPNSHDGFSDRFQFTVYAPPYFDIGDCLQFAICYRVSGDVEHWDSNYGQNYALVCCAGAEVAPAFNPMPLSPSTNAFL